MTAPHIRLALPCFGGQITVACHRSVTLLTHALNDAGVGWTLDHELHESLVQRARNGLTHRFLRSEATHLLFIDADIDFRPADVLGMLAANKPMVCGAYPRKTLDEGAVIAAARRYERDPFGYAGNHNVNVLPGAPGETEATLTATDGCVPILEAATGFLLIQRDVLLQMAAALPETLYYSDSSGNRGEAMHALFDCAIVGGRYLSEDWLFSKRWRDLGGTVWLYLPAKLGHVGSYTYRGDLFTKFVPVDGEARSVAPDGGATEWCDIPSLPESDPQKRWHLERYEWAAKRLTGSTVANAPCGTNYGTAILGAPGRDVIGFDRSEEAARISGEKGRGLVRVLDLERESIGGDFDSVVCLEGLEHLRKPWTWLGALPQSVKELVLSVPIVPTTHANKFHLHDFTDSLVRYGVAHLGWTITDTMYQSEWQPKAVLLLRAER